MKILFTLLLSKDFSNKQTNKKEIILLMYIIHLLKLQTNKRYVMARKSWNFVFVVIFEEKVEDIENNPMHQKKLLHEVVLNYSLELNFGFH